MPEILHSSPEFDPRSPAVKPSWKSVEVWLVVIIACIEALQGARIIDLEDRSRTAVVILAAVLVVARTVLKMMGIWGATQTAIADSRAASPAPNVVAGTVITTGTGETQP